MRHGNSDTGDKPESEQKIVLVEYLRGIAALGVVWFHCTGTFEDGWVKSSGSLGRFGVEAFFVISGFILPFSIWKRHGAGYRVGDFPTFLARRLTRIEPPYLVSVALTIAVLFLAAQARGGGYPDISVRQVASHPLYLAGVLGYEWINPVYWTLAYEFCFYVILGLTFPFIMTAGVRGLVVVTVIALLVTMGAAGRFDHLVLHFAMGVAVFVATVGSLSKAGLCALLLFSGSSIAAAGELASAAAGTATALLLAFGRDFALRSLPHRSLLLLGTISYSLYITHAPIGRRFSNLGARHGEGSELFLFALAGTGASLAFAYLFWRVVERRFVRLSKGIGKKCTPLEHGRPPPPAMC